MKRILIVGATSAIAAACAREWAAREACFFLVGRNASRLETLAAQLRAQGAKATHTWTLDATDTAHHAAMVEAAVAALGQLDVAFVAYGSLPDQAACERDAGLAMREFFLNGTSVIALLTLLAPVFVRQRRGAIGVITSVAGDRGRRSNYLYGSAKAAVSVFCEGLRARLFDAGVSLTDIRPGFVATPMTNGLDLPPALVARPEGVARRIVASMERGADVVYAPCFWAPIMAVVRNIPGYLFKRMTL